VRSSTTAKRYESLKRRNKSGRSGGNQSGPGAHYSDVRWLRLLGPTGVLVALGAGCGASAPAAGAVVAHVGALEIIHPFLPDPASPSVAAVYLMVRNTGATADRLVSATSPLAPASMLMTEQSTGEGGVMAPLAGLVIPAHGTATLQPGHDHLMLERPAAVKVGEDVEVTLRFARAGAVTVKVPVVPLTAIIDDDGAPTTGTTTMKGMNMASSGPA
jgi:copper(I)-binding protein